MLRASQSVFLCVCVCVITVPVHGLGSLPSRRGVRPFSTQQDRSRLLRTGTPSCPLTPPTPHQLLELKKADKLLQMQHPSSNKSLFHRGHTEKRSPGRPVIPDACNSVSSRLLLAAPLHLCSRCARCGPPVRMQESRYHR